MRVPRVKSGRLQAHTYYLAARMGPSGSNYYIGRYCDGMQHGQAD